MQTMNGADFSALDAGEHHRVPHAVEDFFVGGAHGGQNAAEDGVFLLRRAEEVGTQAHAALHEAGALRFLAPRRMRDDPGRVEALAEGDTGT